MWNKEVVVQNTYIPRIPQFMVPRRIWDPPTPSPATASEWAHPQEPKGGVACTLARGCGSGGVSIPTTGWRISLAFCLHVLCGWGGGGSSPPRLHLFSQQVLQICNDDLNLGWEWNLCMSDRRTGYSVYVQESLLGSLLAPLKWVGKNSY
jgi:hypothetical protein